MNRKFAVLLTIIGAGIMYIMYMNGALIMHPKRSLAPVRENSSISERTIDKSGKQNRFLIDFRNAKDTVLVFLHIQKTGGTILENKLLKDIDALECSSCFTNGSRKLLCDCERSNGVPWIVMRYARLHHDTSWPCGMHADLTVLKDCVPKIFLSQIKTNFTQKFLYFTQLRSPVDRYISEFRHVQRGGVWINANMTCKNQRPQISDVSCFQNLSRDNLTLKKFLQCKNNLANNRQTRMLADLELVGCYDYSLMSKAVRDKIMLESAMKNLKTMIYFSLTERPAASQFIFEKTFNLKFKKDWFLYETGYAKEYMKNIADSDVRKIKELNYLDLKLFKFAEKLFDKRLAYLERLTKETHKIINVKKHKKDKNTLKKNWKRKHMMGKRHKMRKKHRMRKKNT